MQTVGRILIVKAIEYSARPGKDDNWQPPRIEDELRLIASKTQNVSERHYPKDLDVIKDGSRCIFINEIKDLEELGVALTVCSYVKGHAPETFSPKLDEPSVDVEVLKLTDASGSQKELAYSYRVLAFGQIIIVENVMGSGGIGMLERLLRSLLRKAYAKRRPLLSFSDVESRDLRELIKSKNGIKQIRATMLHSAPANASRFARPLSDVHQAVNGTNRCVISWEASDEDEIDINDGIELLDDPAVNSVSVQFNSGGGFKSLDEYRERKPVRIQVTPEGRIAATEVETQLLAYLRELRDPDHQGPITPEGILRTMKPIGTK